MFKKRTQKTPKSEIRRAEKYLKDGVDLEELNKEFVQFHKHSIFLVEDTFKSFFRQEVKPTLTEDEKVILRKVRKIWKIVIMLFQKILLNF